MTTYTGVINKSTITAAATNPRSIHRLNLVLLTAIIMIFAIYIFLTNFLAAQKYLVEVRQKEFRTINSGTVAQGGDLKSITMEKLLSYAQEAGMVEAKDTDSILRESGVAQNQW